MRDNFVKRLRNNEKASVKTSNTWLCSPICNCLICEKPKIISVRKEKKMLNDAFENYENLQNFAWVSKKKENRDLGPLWIVTLDSEKIDNDFVKSLKKPFYFTIELVFSYRFLKKIIIRVLRANLLKLQSSCHTNYQYAFLNFFFNMFIWHVLAFLVI